MSSLPWRGRCASCGKSHRHHQFYSRKLFKHYPISSRTPLLCPFEAASPHPTGNPRLCRVCYGVQLRPAYAKVKNVLLSTTAAIVAAVSADRPPPAAVVACEFFSSHRSRSNETDQLLLGDCSAYLNALVGMVTCVVGLDLAPDSLSSTRILDTGVCTRERWAAVLRADNHVAVGSYPCCAIDGVSAKQTVFERCAMGQTHVYLDYPIFPAGLTEMGLGRWEAEVEQRRWQKVINDKPPVSASGRNRDHPYREEGEQEWRRRLQVLISHDEPCLGLSDADREEKRADNFYTDLSLPDEVEGVSTYIHSTDCPTIYNFGPINTQSHHDGVGGVSQLVEGWKVFCWWQPQHSHLLHYDTATNLFSLKAATKVASFQWALLGPGASIALPADVPHCVVTLTSSLLFTWSTDHAPSRSCRLLGFILAGMIHDPVWLHDWQNNKSGQAEHWLHSRHYVTLLRSIFEHTVARVNMWQQQGELAKVQATAKAWQEARAEGMDDAFSRPFVPRNGLKLSPTNTRTLCHMYGAMNACMQQWAVKGDGQVNTDQLMTKHCRMKRQRKRRRD
jgi:hypothetical protein